MFSIPTLDKFIILAGNGSTAFLAFLNSQSGPAWLTAGATAIYLIAKAWAVIYRAKNRKSED